MSDERIDYRHEPSLEDMLNFSTKGGGYRGFQNSDMMNAMRRWQQQEGNEHRGSRWFIEDPNERKRSLLQWAAGRGGGGFDERIGANANTRTAMEMDLYGQGAKDVLEDELTDSYRGMARLGYRPPKVMEDMSDWNEPSGGWAFWSPSYGWSTDPDEQYFPANRPPLKALPQNLKNMMESLKDAGTPPQHILDEWTDPNSIHGPHNRHYGMPTDRDKYWRKKGGPRDRFLQRSAIEAALLLNELDNARIRDNKAVLEAAEESGLVEAGNYAGSYASPRSDWSSNAKRAIYETEEDEPVIWNEAFDEGWQLMNRSDDAFDTAWLLVKSVLGVDM
jgi:hypothetical protein